MTSLILEVEVLLAVIVMGMVVQIVQQFDDGTLSRLGRVGRQRGPGLRLIIPFVDVLPRVGPRIVTMPIPSQGITTGNNVAASTSPPSPTNEVVDPVKPVAAIEDLDAAIDRRRPAVARHPEPRPTPHPPRIDKD